LLQRVLDAAAASDSLTELVLVLGPVADEIRAALAVPAARPLRVVEVPPGGAQSDSLRAGLAAVAPQSCAAAILLGDQPDVTASLIDSVGLAFRAGGAPAARPVWRDAGGRRVPGHPVFLARELFAAVARLRGDEGARALFAARRGMVLEVPMPGRPPADLDTWRDYAARVRARG
jgi:molybdenum cofactor cytidylyltransferase